MAAIHVAVILVAIVLVGFHVVWSLTPKTDFSILQVSSTRFDGAVFSQRRPMILEIPSGSPQPEADTIETLCRGHVWSGSGEYVLQPAAAAKSTSVIRNRHKFMWLLNSAGKETPKIRLYSPSPVATPTHMPFIEVIMRPGFALMVPRSWMFSVHDADVSMFYMDDTITKVINWCCVFGIGGDEGTNVQNM